MTNSITSVDNINEFRVTFSHPDYGLTTGFVCLGCSQAPTSGKFQAYCPALRKTIEFDWEVVISCIRI